MKILLALDKVAAGVANLKKVFKDGPLRFIVACTGHHYLIVLVSNGSLYMSLHDELVKEEYEVLGFGSMDVKNLKVTAAWWLEVLQVDRVKSSTCDGKALIDIIKDTLNKKLSAVM